MYGPVCLCRGYFLRTEQQELLKMAGTTLQERGLLSPHTQPQRLKCSDYTCILCTEEELSRALSPCSPCYLNFSPSVCGCTCTRAKGEDQKEFKKIHVLSQSGFSLFSHQSLHIVLASATSPPRSPSAPAAHISSKSCLWSSGRRGCLP